MLVLASDQVGALQVVERVLALDVPGAVAHAFAAGYRAEDGHGRVLDRAEAAIVALTGVQVVEAACHVLGAVLLGVLGGDHAGGERPASRAATASTSQIFLLIRIRVSQASPPPRVAPRAARRVDWRGRRSAARPCSGRQVCQDGGWNMCPEGPRLDGVDDKHMAPMQSSDGSELEFFGVKLKVENPHLAALLNSDVNEDVQVIGRRAREAFRSDEASLAERDVRCAHAPCGRLRDHPDRRGRRGLTLPRRGRSWPAHPRSWADDVSL